MAHNLSKIVVGVVPGTGRMGSLLARHYAQAGLMVWVGSRDAAKARSLAQELRGMGDGRGLQVEGGTNAEAAERADVVFWCIQGSMEERHAALRGLQEELKGKVIVDVTNIMYLPQMGEAKWGQVSSTLTNQEALGVKAKWTCAWKSTFWKLLEDPPATPHCTFVCGDDPEAVALTMQLVELVKPFRAVNAGGLKNTRIVELLGPGFIVDLDKLNCDGHFRGGWQFGT